jgi:hypothetical protein
MSVIAILQQVRFSVPEQTIWQSAAGNFAVEPGPVPIRLLPASEGN